MGKTTVFFTQNSGKCAIENDINKVNLAKDFDINAPFFEKKRV